MRSSLTAVKVSLWQLVSVSVVLVAGCATPSAQQGSKVTLSGAQEVPPITTSASGSGEITVSSDRSVSGSVTTSGIAGTAAHIHEAAAGKNGPVAVPLTKSGDNTWVVPAGSKLTEAQFGNYQAGNLYVNVHSAARPAGEIRGQIIPPGGIKAGAAPASSGQPATTGGTY